MACRNLKIENKKRTISQKKEARWEHVAATTQDVAASVCVECGKQQEQMHGSACRGGAWLQTGLVITIKDKYQNGNAKGHELWGMIESGRTRVWCRRCARYAKHKCGKLWRNKC